MEQAKNLQNTISRTAEYTCMCRASSFLEKNSCYKSNDDISLILLPHWVRILLKSKIMNLKGRISPRGIYEYVIGRTKYIDEAFQQALRDGVDQILIFGAGFDSRAIRFLKTGMNTRVFELDSPVTQQAKEKQLAERGIVRPVNNIYIPIDFNSEDAKGKLQEYGFELNKKSMFILEGLIMYLNSESVDNTFQLIHDLSAPGSKAIFDCIFSSVLREEFRFYGEKEIYSRIMKGHEPWVFAIEEGHVEEFLQERNFRLVDYMDSNTIEKRYFNNNGQGKSTRVNATHFIVTAERQ
jgi:methyltransferase (TIGR00027 family)